jgi:uncharacterized protein YecA (UPF0149 family)
LSQMADYWKRQQMLAGVPRIMNLEPRAQAPQKIGRNDPCPCGSGKKYKKCCGRSL